MYLALMLLVGLTAAFADLSIDEDCTAVRTVLQTTLHSANTLLDRILELVAVLPHAVGIEMEWAPDSTPPPCAYVAPNSIVETAIQVAFLAIVASLMAMLGPYIVFIGISIVIAVVLQSVPMGVWYVVAALCVVSFCW